METIHTIGRRKASVARIYMSKGKGVITVNKKDYKDFFPVEVLQKKVVHPFSALDLEGKFFTEIGKGQANLIKEIVSFNNLIYKESNKDLSGITRVLVYGLK